MRIEDITTDMMPCLKSPVLAIEVDGYEYHKEDTVQASRDLLKNHIMELYEIPLTTDMMPCLKSAGHMKS